MPSEDDALLSDSLAMPAPVVEPTVALDPIDEARVEPGLVPVAPYDPTRRRRG